MPDDMRNDITNSTRPGWSRLTSLARVLDPRLPSHRMALIIGVGSALLGAAVDGDPGWGLAFNAGVGSFLGWALAREIDPDRPNSAALSGALTGAAIALGGPSLLLPVALILMTARVLHRSTGVPPTLLDLVALIAVAYAGGTSTVGWACGMALAYAIARDHRLPSPAPRFQLAAAFVVAGAASAGAVIGGVSTDWELPGLWAMLVVGVGLVAGISLRVYLPTSTGDHTGDPLEPKRLQSARRGVLGAGLLALAATGGAAVAALYPLWGALTGVAIWDRFGPDKVNHV